MKITIEHEGLMTVVHDENIIDISDVLDLIEVALVQVGFMPERIQAGFLFKCRQIEHHKETEEERGKE